MLETMALQSKLSSQYGFQSHAFWLYYGTFQSVNSAKLSQHCKITELKTFNLSLNVTFISNKAPNLHSEIFSKTNTASITNKRLLTVQGKR